MKNFKFIGIFVLILGLMFGCGGKTVTQVITGACDWLSPYQTQINKTWDKIRADYPLYEAIVTGVVPVNASTLEQARAWIAAADIALKTIGAVINGACRSVQLADVQMALQVGNENLPKVELPKAKLEAVKMKMKK